MTLIVSFTLDQIPFLLGDLLLTTKGNANRLISIPSIGDVPPKYKPYGLTRKVCCFSNIAIAWAGDYGKANSIISRIYNETQNNGPISYEQLEKIFSTLKKKSKKALKENRVGLLGYLIDPLGITNKGFGINYQSFHSSMIDDVKIIGSGKDIFRGYFDHSLPLEIKQIEGVEQNTLAIAICKALGIAGMLLQLEVHTHENLRAFFGGGYEIITLQGNQFINCDDIMFTFWFAETDEKGITIIPSMRIFKQSYQKDILINRTLELKSLDSKNPTHFTQRDNFVYYTTPIYRDVTDKEKSALTTPDLKAFLLCNLILIQSKKGIEVLIKIDWAKNREIPLQFVDEGDNKMTLKIRNKYLEDIFTEIQEHTK